MVASVEPLADYDPRQVGGFRLQARLGAGGMGRVYLGYSPGGRPVAVKVVHPDLARDPEFMQRFRREVAAAQSVSDAYTAAVVGAGPDDSPPWLATTFVAGPSLADLVTRSGPLPEHAVWRLAGGLAEALQAIHSRGLIHRDLKPGNILVAADGPRVIDFGISRTTEGTVVTATHTTIGTPAYMSPEQAQGNPVGPASDVFSLGSVLTFAATGAAPFGSSGTEMFAIAYKVVNGEPELSRVPASLRPLIDACLAKDPAGRPAVSQLIHDVAAGATAYPEVTPGRFWPDQVAAVLESSAFTPVLPPPAPTPAPAPARSPATEHVAGGQYPMTEAVARGQHDTPAMTEPAVVTWLRGRPRWLLPTALAVAVAVGAVIAIVLALSSAPKPPSFLGTNSPTSSTSHTASATSTR
jgi:serine/threonine protein kinase